MPGSWLPRPSPTGRRPRDEILPTAGADEALDLTARAFLREGSVAVGAVPTYAMYGIVTEQRGARFRAVSRREADEGFAAGHSGDGRGRAPRRPRVAVRAEQPDRHRGTAPSALASCWTGLAANAARDGLAAPAVAVDEAYAEFVGSSVVALRGRYPRLVVIRTLSKAHALAGARVGFARGAAGNTCADPFVPGSGSVSTAPSSGDCRAAAPSWPRPTSARIAEQRARLIGR